MGFLKATMDEMKKMKWAKKGEVWKGTLQVLSVVIAIMLFYFVADMGITSLIDIVNDLF